MHEEAASSDENAAEKYVKEFKDYVEGKGFVLQQVFYCNETGLFLEENAKQNLLHSRGEVTART